MSVLEAIERYPEDQFFEIVIPEEDNEMPPRRTSSKRKKAEIVQFKKISLHFKNKSACLLVVKNLTQSVRYKQIEIENQFNELLTATVSHEMRTPLNSMLVLINSIRRYVIGQKGQHLLNTIQSSSMILQYLVNDMLDLYQIKQGKFKKNEQVQDVA